MVRRLTLRLLGLGCAGIVAACQTTAPPSESNTIAANAGINMKGSASTGRGQRALAAGDLEKAREAFSAALRQNPNSVPAGIGMAETYLALDDRDTALRVFDSVSRWAKGVETARIDQGRGLIALRDEEVSEARRLLTSAVDLDPSLWRAWIGLGRIHAREREFNSARIAFARAESNATNLGTVLNDIGMSYLMEREPREAIGFFERALVVDPDLGVARGNLRIARAMDRQYEAAVAGASPTQLADALNNVGYIAVVNGDFDVADTYLRRALEVSPVYHEAAVANLNLLAHAQASGQRPAVETNLSRARAEPAVVAAAPAPAAVTRDTGRLPPPPAPDASKQPAQVAVRTDQVPAQADRTFRWEDQQPSEIAAPPRQTAAARDTVPAGDIGFRWADPASEPLSAAVNNAREKAVRAKEEAAAAARGKERRKRRKRVSDRVDAAEFEWADPTAPLTADLTN